MAYLWGRIPTSSTPVSTRWLQREAQQRGSTLPPQHSLQKGNQSTGPQDPWPIDTLMQWFFKPGAVEPLEFHRASPGAANVGQWGWRQRLGLQLSPIPTSTRTILLLSVLPLEVPPSNFWRKASSNHHSEVWSSTSKHRFSSCFSCWNGFSIPVQSGLYWNLGCRPKSKHLLTLNTRTRLMVL